MSSVSEAIVSLKGVTLKKFGSIILEDINLEIFPHDYVGIIGPNGGGKTTLLRLFLGLDTPTRGDIALFSQNPKISRGKVGYVPQLRNLEVNFPVTVIEVVMMGHLARGGKFGYFKKQDRKFAEKCLAQVGMVEFWRRQVQGLSGGEMQRVFIARALMAEPSLLLLDEPTANVDSPFGETFYQLLSELNKNMAIILVSHDIGVLASQVKTIACLNKKLHYHNSPEISVEAMEQIYGCPVDLIAHGHTHRVLNHHHEEK
ncbi:MAG: ABC transporter ATP-binding protein [Deltaproteobacteria bacterium]|nr:ABC transporter ATP-binding protein [Deltaproteobacteria bacterium]